jgi:hypothetical protein
MARGLGANSELRSVDVQADIQGRVRPRRGLRRCNYAVSGPQRPACGNGNEHAQRGDDDHGQLPSSGFTGAPQIHSAPTVRNTTTNQLANRAVKMIRGFTKNPESTQRLCRSGSATLARKHVTETCHCAGLRPAGIGGRGGVEAGVARWCADERDGVVAAADFDRLTAVAPSAKALATLAPLRA